MNEHNHDDERTAIIWWAFKQFVKTAIICASIIAALYYVTR